MKKLVLAVAFVLSVGVQAYAGNGDLIVDGSFSIPAAGGKTGKLHTTSGDTLRIGAIPTADSSVTDTSGAYAMFTSINGSDGSKGLLALGAGDVIPVFGYDGAINFWTHSLERMRITYNGNVGIGTTSPDAPLHVNGGAAMAAGWNRTSVLQGQFPVQVFNSSGNKFAGIGYDFSTAMRFWVNAASNDVSGTGRLAMSIGNDGNIIVNGTVTASNGLLGPSDIKFKKNLLPINTPLDKVLNLTGLTYEWKTDEYKEKNFQTGRHYGVIAQEIEKVLPEVVNTAPDGSKAVAYTEIIPVLIEAIKEQQKRIDLLEKKLTELGK